MIFYGISSSLTPRVGQSKSMMYLICMVIKFFYQLVSDVLVKDSTYFQIYSDNELSFIG
jgi:hypothetical protein